MRLHGRIKLLPSVMVSEKESLGWRTTAGMDCAKEPSDESRLFHGGRRQPTGDFSRRRCETLASGAPFDADLQPLFEVEHRSGAPMQLIGPCDAELPHAAMIRTGKFPLWISIDRSKWRGFAIFCDQTAEPNAGVAAIMFGCRR